MACLEWLQEYACSGCLECEVGKEWIGNRVLMKLNMGIVVVEMADQVNGMDWRWSSEIVVVTRPRTQLW